MAAQGIAKRATINVKSHFDQQAIDTFEHSLKDLGQTSTHLRDSFDRTNEAFDRFDEHMEMFSQHHSSAMDRLRESDNRAIASDRRFSQRMNDTMDTYNRDADRFSNDTHRINESELSKAQNAANNEHKINESLSHSMTQMRRNSDEIVRENRVMNDHLNHVGVSSAHMGNRISSANGRVARSFHVANNGISRHIQSIREAQDHDYHWLRTAQAMSLTTLGLGANLYKGAKDVGALQQSYLHAGNMAHYGGEKIATVQRHINDQWRVGSQLSIKYGVSQDQIAKGFQALVARGYKTNEALHAQAPLLQAAIASGDSYNDVVQGTTNVLDAYNLRSDNAAKMTNNTKKVTDEMAYAADQTASNFRDLSTGMAYVAATAHTTNQPISETSSALGILSNKGMQASMAGVGLRKVLNSFLSINKKGQQAQVMQQLGLTQNSFRTASGHLKSLGQLMGILNAKTKNMGSAERGAVFHRFFGATGQEAALNLASDTSGLKQLNDQVKRSQDMGKNHQGYVALLSAHNMKSAQNQFNVFKQAWQAFMITSAREILPTFTDALKHADIYIAKMNDLSPRAKKWTIFGALAVAAIAPISYAIFGIQSAFHGVELTLLHVRKLFEKPMPKEMTESAGKQAGQQEKDALKTGSTTKGGIGYNALSLLKAHPTTVGIGSAATLGITMGTLLGVNANYQAKKQVDNLHNQFTSNPIQERIKAELDQTSVNQSLRGNKNFEHQLENQDKVAVNNITGILGNETKSHEDQAKKNVQILQHYAHISKRQANSLFKNNVSKDKDLYNSANKALTAIGKDQYASNQKKLADYKTAYRDINRVIADNGSREQSIYKRLARSNDHLSTQTAARLLRSSYKTTHGQIANANKSYRQTSHFAWKRYNEIKQAAADEYGTDSKNYKRIVNQAAKSRDSEINIAKTKRSAIVQEASTEHQRIMKLAEQQHAGLDNEVNLTTGHFKTEWSETFDWLKNMISDISNLFSHLTGGFSHKLSVAADNAGEFGKTRTATHANGGAIDHDQLSLVNEKGPESAYNPIKNTFRMLGDNGPQVVKLYQGEHVLDAQDTHELLNGGLGRGVTLPGYANGTDQLKNLKSIHGYVNGRGEEIAQSAMHAGNGGENTWNGLKTIESFVPFGGLLSLYGDAKGFAHHPLKSTVGVTSDLPGLSDFKGGKLYKPLGHAMSAIKAYHPITKGIGMLGRITHPATSALHLGMKHIHGYAGKALNKADGLFKDFDKRAFRPIAKHGLKIAEGAGKKLTGALDNKIMKPIRRRVRFGEHILGKFAHSFGKRVLRGAKRLGSRAWRGIKGFGRGTMRLGKRMFRTAGRGLRRFGRGTMRFGRRMFRGGRRLLRRASRGISKFARHTWSGAKHLGRRLWSGTKHVARRMWSTTRRTARRMWTSAKRTGRNIWNNTKRIARNIGRTAHSLWNQTKAGASRTWSHVVSGARRMARAVGSRVRSMVSSAKSKAQSAWSSIKSGVSSAVSTVRSKVSSMVSWVISEAHRAMSVLSHIHIPHFANGGPISKTTMALVGEHGPETAYNARTGMIRMLGMNGPQITTLLAGEEVLTNTQTNRLLHGGLGRGNHLPAYAKGTDAQLSGPASRTSSFNIIGSFSGKRAINNMNDFSKKAKAIWDDVSSYITSGSQDMSKSVTKTNSDLSDSVRDIFKDMSKKVGSLSDDLRDGLVEAAKDMAEGFGDKFKKLITYAKDDMEDVIDKLNRGVSGIDVALRAFGGNSHVIHKIHYATGTMNGRLTHDQIGILNDAITGPRQEAILRDGQVLMPQGDNVPVPLQKGDAVLNGDQTKQLIKNTTNINHYAKGSGFHFNMKRVNSLIKVLSLALKGPAAFFKKSFSSLVGKPSGHQLTKGLDETGIQAVKPLGVKWTRAMFSYIHSLINPPDSGSASASAFLNYAMKLAARAHYHYSEAPGRTGPNHYDCSGLVYAALTHFGIHPSGSTAGPEIFDSGFKPISRSQARIGDLVGNAGHIGIVANNDATKYYSAFSPSMGIGMHPLDTTWWDGGSFNFRRVPQLAKYNQPKHKKATPYLQRLVASELGPTAIHWLKALAPVLNTDSGGAGLAKGNGAISTAWNEFAKLGMSPTQIMGALGGAKQESEFNPLAHDPDGGLGLFQATPPYGNLRAYAAEHHEDWKDPAVQAKQYYEHWLKPSGYLSTHGSVYDEALAAAKVEASSSIHGSLAPDSDFGVRLAGARYIQRWYQMHKHANGGWASSPAIFGEDGPEVAINPAKDTADHYIVEAINARMHNNSNSPISNLVHSMGLSQKSDELRKRINDLLFNHVAKPSKPVKSNPVNINISFGDIVVNGNGGNVNTAAIANKVKKAVQHGIQQAAYRTTHKLNLD